MASRAPSGPSSSVPANTAAKTVNGDNPTASLVTRGTITASTTICRARMNPATATASNGETVNARKTAGIPPIHGQSSGWLGQARQQAEQRPVGESHQTEHDH